MPHLNRDAIIAIILLMFCGTMFWATTQIRDPGFEQMSATVWPRIVLIVLTALSALYLFQSLKTAALARDDAAPSGAAENGAKASWLERYQNPIWCFVLFFGFLIALPYLGMLLGASLFVFLMMSVLGGWSPRLVLLHAVIAILSVGAMWSIFTFGLRVMLPQGELLQLL